MKSSQVRQTFFDFFESKEQSKIYQNTNQEKVKIRHKKYQKENREKRTIYEKKYREANADKIKAWRKENKERFVMTRDAARRRLPWIWPVLFMRNSGSRRVLFNLPAAHRRNASPCGKK